MAVSGRISHSLTRNFSTLLYFAAIVSMWCTRTHNNRFHGTELYSADVFN